MADSPVFECTEVPSDSLQFYKDDSGRVWAEMRTAYYARRITIVFCDADKAALLNWLKDNE